MLWEGDGGSLQVRSQVREPQTLNSQLSTTAAKPKGRLGFRVTTNHCLCFLALPFAGARCQEGPPLGHVSLIYSSRKKRETPFSRPTEASGLGLVGSGGSHLGPVPASGQRGLAQGVKPSQAQAGEVRFC